MKTVVDRRAVLKSIGGFAIAAGFGGSVVMTARADGSLLEVNGGSSGSPAGALVWRVVRDTAMPVGEGPELERALGFLIANHGPLTVQRYEDALFVAQGETLYVPEAEIQRQESATGAPLPYVRFGLVDPVEATYTAGAELIFGSEFQHFQAGATVDLRLYEAHLQGAERVTLPSSVANGTVIYADSGSIGVVGVTEDGELTEHRYDLNPGEAWAPTVANQPPHHWEAVGAGEAAAATFYVATATPNGDFDPDVSVEPEESASGNGTVTVLVYGCPEDVESMNSEVCGPWAGKFSLELESFATGLLLTKSDAVASGDAAYRFEAPYGSYLVRPDVFNGPGSISVQINGIPVQNPTVVVDSTQPETIVEFFFRY